MNQTERDCLHGAMRCLVRAQLAHWSAPVVERVESEPAARWQAQALAWLAKLMPPDELAVHLRPIGGRLPSAARRREVRVAERAA